MTLALLIIMHMLQQILNLLKTKAVLQEKKTDANQKNAENTEQGDAKTKKILKLLCH